MQWTVAVTLGVYWGLVIWVLICFRTTCTRSTSDSVNNDTEE